LVRFAVARLPTEYIPNLDDERGAVYKMPIPQMNERLLGGGLDQVEIDIRQAIMTINGGVLQQKRPIRIFPSGGP